MKDTTSQAGSEYIGNGNVGGIPLKETRTKNIVGARAGGVIDRMTKNVPSSNHYGGGITNHGVSKQVHQTLDLCQVVDKQRTGKVTISNFLRIAQVCGLKIDSIMLQRYTNQVKNSVNYTELTGDILQQEAAAVA